MENKRNKKVKNLLWIRCVRAGGDVKQGARCVHDEDVVDARPDDDNDCGFVSKLGPRSAQNEEKRPRISSEIIGIVPIGTHYCLVDVLIHVSLKALPDGKNGKWSSP